ncbi:Hsp70 family protein, partial [Streptomyces sp. NRRL S-350]|uniref:Hsp70 family protein n=1 Tax=Streptomyces sp. NRRL S-350 TaxID=1463902 RepID=UPI0004BFF4ED
LPPAPRGLPQIEVTFDIDANGIMHVGAKDLGTGREQKMTVTGGSSLPKDDIERMVRDAEAHAEEDRRRKEAADTRNSAEHLVYGTEKLLTENPDRIPADVKSDVEAALAEVKEKLKGEDTAALRAAVERAASVAQKIGTALYSQAPPGQAAGAQAAGTGPGEEEVVDAEIVDDDTRGGAPR